MRTDEQCKLLCPPVKLDAAKAKAFRTRVEEEYRVNMCAFPAPGYHLGAACHAQSVSHS